MAPPPAEWDGKWTVVHTWFAGTRRLARDRVNAILRADGFAGLAPGLSIHPRHRIDRIHSAVASEGDAARLLVLRGDRIGTMSGGEFARAHWPLDHLAEGYRRFVRRYGQIGVVDLDGFEAFAIRFALVFDYLELAWADPELPERLLPAGWPGLEARRLARRLYQALLPASIRYAGGIMARVLPGARAADR